MKQFAITTGKIFVTDKTKFVKIYNRQNPKAEWGLDVALRLTEIQGQDESHYDVDACIVDYIKTYLNRGYQLVEKAED